MTLQALGDSAWLVEFPDLTGAGATSRVMALAAALASDRPRTVLDVVPSFDSLAVHFTGSDDGEIAEWIQAARPVELPTVGEAVEIPVKYGGDEGPDLESVAVQTGLSAAAVIELHSGAEYTVAAIGFSPGFPYLSGLPEGLRVPRLATPRTSVPSGSVAIANGQAGIYPFSSPGGWHLVGRTGFALFNPAWPQPAALKPGDRVRFVPVSSLPTAKPEPLAQDAFASDRWLEVIDPGTLTTVQDLGRPGHEISGVSPGGAVALDSLRLANLLVGNSANAAVLEFTLRGPVLRFHHDAVVAVATTTGKPRRVAAGDTLDFSQFGGALRACFAVDGGISVPQVLASRSTDLQAGFGGFHGRPLRAGDRLAIGTGCRIPRGDDWHVGMAAFGRILEIELRFLRGVQQNWFSEAANRYFREQVFQLSPRSDRMGSRLEGPALELLVPRLMVSQPVACGSIQVPPDGQPIILMAARQTIGGYPQIGHVISADLPLLARAWPGTRIRFREVSLPEAQRLKSRRVRDFEKLRTGLELLKSQSCG